MENIIVNKSVHYRVLFTGLLIFVLTLPLSKSISSIVMGVIYAYCLAVIAFDKDFRRTLVRNISQPLNASLILFVLIILFGSLFSQDIANGLNFVKQVSNLLTIYIAVSVLVDAEQDEAKRRRKTEILLLFFIAGIFILDILGLLTYAGVIGNKKNILPVTPLNMHHIWAGNLNAIGLYVAACLFLFSAKRGRLKSIFLALFVLVAIISVLLSTSRTAWAGMFVTISVSAYFLIRRKVIYFIAAASMLIGSAGIYLYNAIVYTRINQIFNDFSLFFAGVTSTSIGLRLLMWKAAIEMFLSNPLFGVGPGDYKSTIATFVSASRFPESILRYNQPHNMYLFALATTGLIGFLSLAFIFFKALLYAGKLLCDKNRIFGALAMAVSLHFMTAGFTESLFNIHILTCSFALISGVCIRQSQTDDGTFRRQA